MKIAVLYQKNEAPVSGGLKKPMKPGGYRDSGADIAFCLRENGMPVAVPAEEPDVFEDLDWVFPDTEAGIARALAAGADTLWLNTVLYDGHPIERFGGVYVVGQAPADAAVYDNKFRVNARLRAAGFPVVPESLVGACGTYGGPFPCILKPVRGRGSQGVVRCDSGAAFQRALRDALESGRFGDKMIAEPFLSGAEITVSVFRTARACRSSSGSTIRAGLRRTAARCPWRRTAAPLCGRMLPCGKSGAAARRRCAASAFGDWCASTAARMKAAYTGCSIST